jgi:hypothetical protein
MATIEGMRRTGKLVWFDRPNDEQLLLLYNAAALLAVPSRYEGFGLTAIEGMACGTPVLASDGSSLREVVGDAGILLPPDDEEAWAAALLGQRTPAMRARDTGRWFSPRKASSRWPPRRTCTASPPTMTAKSPSS